MINLVPTSKKRDSFFFKKYEYAVGFYINYVYLLRDFRKPDFDEAAVKLKVYEHYKDYSSRGVDGNIDSALNTLLPVYRHLIAETDNKVAVQFHYINIYTNDPTPVLDIAEKCRDRFQDYAISYSKAVITRPEGTIVRNKSEYKMRIFLKAKTVTQTMKRDITNFLSTYKDYVSASPALKKWLSPKSTRAYSSAFMESYYFIDTKDPALLGMFALAMPGIESKTIDIIKDK